jgi:hypothetical protein
MFWDLRTYSACEAVSMEEQVAAGGWDAEDVTCQVKVQSEHRNTA